MVAGFGQTFGRFGLAVKPMHGNALVWRFLLLVGIWFGQTFGSFGSVEHLVKIWSFGQNLVIWSKFGQAQDLVHLVAGFGLFGSVIWFG